MCSGIRSHAAPRSLSFAFSVPFSGAAAETCDVAVVGVAVDKSHAKCTPENAAAVDKWETAVLTANNFRYGLATIQPLLGGRDEHDRGHG